MKNQNNILVIGATGKTDRKVAESLHQKGYNVRSGSRNSSPSFDWNDPQGWPATLEGIDKMYIVYYPDLAVPGAFESISTLVEMAKEAGIQKAVLLSGKGETEAERCETVVAQSGLDYTLVRASWFNQNFSESFLLDPVLAGHVALPLPEAQVPFVDTGDIADVVVEALMNDAWNGQTVEVTGLRLLSFEEVVGEIAKASGRNIQFQSVSMQAYHQMMKSAGLPEDYIWLFDYLFREVLGDPQKQVVSYDTEKVLGRKAKDFSEYAQETAQSGIWNQKFPQTI